ncbi:MAG: hypothetical protein ACOZCL_15770 [Bacillota bacterium]
MNSEMLTIQEWHKKQAVDNFNYTWDLIDKQDKNDEDKLEMIHAAHTSRYHWGKVGGPAQLATGEWQISRVYALLGMGEGSLFHGLHSLRICRENNFGGFDIGFAYEAVARAYMILGDKENMLKYVKLAKECASGIEKDEDREYFLSEVNTIGL